MIKQLLVSGVRVKVWYYSACQGAVKKEKQDCGWSKCSLNKVQIGSPKDLSLTGLNGLGTEQLVSSCQLLNAARTNSWLDMYVHTRKRRNENKRERGVKVFTQEKHRQTESTKHSQTDQTSQSSRIQSAYFQPQTAATGKTFIELQPSLTQLNPLSVMSPEGVYGKKAQWLLVLPCVVVLRYPR